MKLLIDARTMGSRPSGIGIYIFNFLKEMIKDKSFEIILLSDISVSEEMSYFTDKGVQIVNYGKSVKKNLGLFSYYRFIQSQINIFKPDIFWEPNNLMPINIRNKYGKIMITVHDLFPVTMPEYYGIIYEYYFKLGLRKTLKNVDAILYNSEETKKDMEALFPKAKDKINFISYIIVNKIIPVEEIEDKGFFLYVGNLEKRKGVDLLLKAFLEYKKRGGAKELYLCGKMRENNIQQIFDVISGQVDGLKYLGYVDDKKKNSLYAQCSCLVLPSKAEGFGIPPVEIMNYYKPVITSDLSIFKEIMEGYVNYFSLDNNEEISINNLCDVMMQYNKAVEKECDHIVKKYDAPALIKRLKSFLDTL